MRIAYVTNQYPKITHTFVRTEIAAVERAGVEVERIAIRRPDGPLLDAADRAEAGRTRVVLDGGGVGLLVALLRTAAHQPYAFVRALRTALRIGWRSERGILFHLAYFAEACVVLRWVTERRVDHLHACFGSNPAAVALLCRMLGGPPYSFTIHGSDEFERARRSSVQEKIDRAAFVAIVSEAGRLRLQQSCRPDLWDRIHLVRCGVDPRFSTRDPTPVPSDRRIVFVGRLAPEKAPLLLVDAVARLNAAGETCDLAIVGDGPLRAAVESRVRALAMGERVRLIGWASNDEVQRQILAARALVLPSFSEGVPMVLMEALALHRPAICTAVGGVVELVESGVCGWVVAPGSVDALADAIRKALNAAPAELQRMGHNGAARVTRQHDADAAARTLTGLFAASARLPLAARDRGGLSLQHLC